MNLNNELIEGGGANIAEEVNLNNELIGGVELI